MILGIPLLQLFVTLPLELDLFVLFCISFGTPLFQVLVPVLLVLVLVLKLPLFVLSCISFGTPLFQVLVPVLLLPGCNISYGTPFPVVVP